MRLLSFWMSHREELAAMVERHLFLVLWSTVIATAIGLPAGIVAAHRPRIGPPLRAAASIAQTSPTPALPACPLTPPAPPAPHRPAIGRPRLAAASIAQAIPSLALLGFLLPLPFIGGIGPRIAIVALILYALLPIVASTAARLRSITS